MDNPQYLTLKEYWIVFKNKALYFIFNHLLRPMTFLALTGVILHIKYPEDREQIDIALASIMTALKG